MNRENEEYYFPEVTEFHQGFQYEFNNTDRWVKCICSHDTHPAYENWDDISKCFRVKRLDHNDIIECGWEDKGYYNGSHYFEINQYCLAIKFETSEVHIYTGIAYQIRGDSGGFKGKILNKSELQRLMKMVGIERK